MPPCIGSDSEAAADEALNEPAECLPFLPDTEESWHAVLMPIAHRGACNFLDPDRPGTMFQAESDDPGGPLVVITTAGFDLGPQFDVERAKDFRLNVDRVRALLGHTDGLIAVHVFKPLERATDGATMTVWRDEAAAAKFAYRPGFHRSQIDRYKAEHTADRTSFTRLRALRTAGRWEGRDPIEDARRQVVANRPS